MKSKIALGALALGFLLAGFVGAAQHSGRWELLGQREVDFRQDHDRIDVGRRDGKFQQLQIRVKNAPIEISNVVVTFANDKSFKPSVRRRFQEGSGTQMIDLPGERRTIKSVDFRYRSVSHRAGKGTVAVYGR